MFVLLNLSVLIRHAVCPKSLELLAQAIVMMPKLHSMDVRFTSNRHSKALPVIVFHTAGYTR